MNNRNNYFYSFLRKCKDDNEMCFCVTKKNVNDLCRLQIVSIMKSSLRVNLKNTNSIGNATIHLRIKRNTNSITTRIPLNYNLNYAIYQPNIVTQTNHTKKTIAIQTSLKSLIHVYKGITELKCKVDLPSILFKKRVCPLPKPLHHRFNLSIFSSLCWRSFISSMFCSGRYT